MAMCSREDLPSLSLGVVHRWSPYGTHGGPSRLSKQRAKGTYFVTQICLPLLQEYYPGATQAPAWGNKDKGDVILPGETRFILEMKSEKTMKLPEWTREAKAEAANADVSVGVVVHKRVGTQNPNEQWVTTTLGDFLRLVA